MLNSIIKPPVQLDPSISGVGRAADSFFDLLSQAVHCLQLDSLAQVGVR